MFARDQLIGRLDDLLQTDADDIANFIEGLWSKVLYIVILIMKISYIFTPQKCNVSGSRKRSLYKRISLLEADPISRYSKFYREI